MFLDNLPAELRLKVYHVIIERTIVTRDVSKREDERLYGGLIISCKQILAEYKFEAEKLMPPLAPDMHTWSLDLNVPPVIIAQPGNLSYPTHMHISVPATLFVYEEEQIKDSEDYLEIIFREVIAHHTRITFSLHDTENFVSKTKVHGYLARLYDIICQFAIRKMPDGENILVFHGYLGGYRCDFEEAEGMWNAEGYEVGEGEAPPVYNCDNVALYMDRKVIVYDARMSRKEVRGADSGYLWVKGNATREQNMVRKEMERIEKERLKAWSEELRRH